ncbi:MAG TPA: phosphoglycerate dehydrogenase [Spirochaetia bacterium]|nr:phosphoglycerate dehydrogenase [Spirochaetia bacterium]
MTRKPLSECRILVTPTSFGKADPTLISRLQAACAEVVPNATGKPLSAGQLAGMLQNVDGYIAGLDEINDAALALADKLQVISRYGVGVDNVDLAAARKRGIVVTNTPGANSVSVAELTVGLILSAIRHIPEAVAATRAGEWPRLSGVTLRNKTVGIVGYGAIGRCVAERLLPFGCRLLAFDPYAQGTGTEGTVMTSLDELLRESDIVTLHAPVTDDTRRMVNATFLRAMKPSAYLVNTARGELIEEEALVRALQEGRLAGAAIDVFDREPLPKDSPLLALPRLIATPHMAAHTDDAMNAMGEIAMSDCLSVLRGEEPAHPVS